MSNGKQRVSDVISINDIESWTPKDIVVISAGTGAGKSYFIKNHLYKYAKAQDKKILFLIHRRNCVEQFIYEIKRDNKDDVIDIRTYQKIENDILLLDKHIDYDRYAYIVSDEFHYFISDAGFNNTTDISFEEILNQDNCIKIFMSATGDNVKNYLYKKYKKICLYEIPHDYKHVKSLTFFPQDDAMSDLAKDIIKDGKKGMFFIQSAKKAYKLFKEFEEYSIFNCGKSDKHYKYVNEEKISDMLKNEKFDTNLLITTSCFDAGANIIDEDVEYIIADIVDVGSLIQCLGRKRIQSENDKVNYYIKTINNQQLAGLMRSTSQQIEKAEYLLSHNTQELLQKYPRQVDKSYIIYDMPTNNRLKNMATKHVNKMKLAKKRDDIEFYRMLMQEEYGYCKYLARCLGFYIPETDFYIYDVFSKDYSINAYLEENVGKVMLQAKDRKELINKLNVRSVSRKQLKSKEALNAAMQEMKLPYQIEEFRMTKIIDGKKKDFKNVWKLIQC